MKTFNKILIANRGEIAVRIMKTAKKLGIATVAVYSEVDKDSMHVSFADEAWCIGVQELGETYLNIGKIISVALKTGCDAIHPGYGFMSENSLFVKECDKAGLVFIGPNTNAMKIMGNKIEARNFVKSLNIPLTQGITGNAKTLLSAGKTILFPLLVKAAAGGGGKGMRIVQNPEELKEAIEATSREAKSYFGDDTVYVEKFIEDPRHIEVQILGDNYGNVVHLFERECSIQRRYQKIIEESPSPTLTPEVRLKMGQAAVDIGKAIKYNNAGTIEFLVDKDLNFYFLEMNTRIQVEHPVTEMVTGIDIVEEQIFIAAGNKLRLKQENIRQNGHSIECRIYAEDPANGFLPSPGKMYLYKEPSGDLRIETAITAGTEIKSFFDPMICKLVVWDKNRDAAAKKMSAALGNYIIHGIKTNITYLIALLKSQPYIKNKISTKYCDIYTNDIVESINKEAGKIHPSIPVISYLIYSLQNPEKASNTINVWEEIGYWRDYMCLKISLNDKDYEAVIEKIINNEFVIQFEGKTYRSWLIQHEDGKYSFSIDGKNVTVYISEDNKGIGFLSYNGHIFSLMRKDVLAKDHSVFRMEDFVQDTNTLTSPMPGKVIKLNVSEGDMVKKGDLVMIIEAMKMENRIFAPKDCKIKQINFKPGDMVETSSGLVLLD